MTYFINKKHLYALAFLIYSFVLRVLIFNPLEILMIISFNGVWSNFRDSKDVTCDTELTKKNSANLSIFCYLNRFIFKKHAYVIHQELGLLTKTLVDFYKIVCIYYIEKVWLLDLCTTYFVFLFSRYSWQLAMDGSYFFAWSKRHGILVRWNTHLETIRAHCCSLQ